MTSELITCHELEVGHANRAILPAINLVIQRGELWAVIGRNGAGKTTWLRTILGLANPVGGKIDRAPSLRLSYLPQRSEIDELYPLLAREVVSMGVERHWSFLAFSRKARATQVERALSQMGVADLADRPFRQLSEGQKQRVRFARVAVSDADLAILDEPTSAMDVIAEREAFALLDELRHERNLAIVIVSHYLGLAREFADHALLLDRDVPAAVVGSPDEVFASSVFLARYGKITPSENHA